MSKVTIWALESDYDRDTVRCLAEKLTDNKSISIRAVGTGVKPKRLKGKRDPDAALKRKIELYLKEDDCVIFVLDKDGPMASYQRRQEANSLINQVERMVKDKDFRGKVHIAHAIQEIEAWLLVDCMGIFCYFASQRKEYREKCREKASKKQEVIRVIKKFQRGNTELIVEAEAGGKGVKEYLVKFSKEIFRTLNPKVRPPKDKLYKEKLSPKIAEHIEISSETLRRNASLRHLGELIKQCDRSS